MTQSTMSIRMDRDNYEFLSELTREERTDLSKTASRTGLSSVLGHRKISQRRGFPRRAAELAVCHWRMTVLSDFGVESRLEKEDYLQGLQNLRKSL